MFKADRKNTNFDVFHPARNTFMLDRGGFKGVINTISSPPLGLIKVFFVWQYYALANDSYKIKEKSH